MSTTLITFLGKSVNSKGRGYREARYEFVGGFSFSSRFFGLSLAKWLQNKDKSVDKIVFLGSSTSMWDVLAEEAEDAEIWEGVADPLSEGKPIDAKTLAEIETPWRLELQRRLQQPNLKVHLRLIPLGRNADEQRDILSIIADSLENDSTAVFDITHGLRHMPMVSFASALYLRQAKNVTISGIYYGAFDLRRADGATPVIELDGLLDIADWVEGVATFQNSGRYQALVPLMQREANSKKIPVLQKAAEKLQRGAYLEEAMQIDAAARELATVNKRLSDPSVDGSIAALFREKLNSSFAWTRTQGLASQQLGVAMRALEVGAYLRAALAGLEALVSKQLEHKKVLTPKDYNVRQSERSSLREKTKLPQQNAQWTKIERAYFQINQIRNAMAHGSRIKTKFFDLDKLLKSEEKVAKRLKDLINSIAKDA